MNRRRFALLPLTALALLRSTAGACVEGGATPITDAYPPVVPGRVLVFPDDEGSHPSFRIEWWYLTGWLTDEASKVSGFQLTFFRSRPVDTGGNPSRFTPTQLFIAHIALADPQRERLLLEQRIARGVFGLAAAAERHTEVRIGDWRMHTEGNTLHAQAAGRELGLDLTATRTQAPLLNGELGFSRKGPAAESASYYYSLPHLRIEGSVSVAGRKSKVSGTGWLDHEWSSAPLEQPASGWDWLGINLDDGGALMIFRVRSASRANLWSGATLRDKDGATRTYSPQQVAWLPLRHWNSPRTGAAYPVAWNVRIDELVIRIEPLMDDQELDARVTTGTIYWEGAVTAQVGGREVGRGYLELTGYWRSFRP